MPRSYHNIETRPSYPRHHPCPYSRYYVGYAKSGTVRITRTGKWWSVTYLQTPANDAAGLSGKPLGGLYGSLATVSSCLDDM